MITLKNITIALAFVGSTAAMAQEGTQDFRDVPLSSRSRAAVLAELDQARASGELNQRGHAYGSFGATDVASTHSRTEVLAELDMARRAGRIGRPVYGSFPPGEIASTRSRAEVVAELREVQATGRRLSQGDRG